MGGQAFQVQSDRILDVPLRLLHALALRVTARKSWNEGHVASFGRLFVVDRIGQLLWALLFITFIVGGITENRKRNADFQSAAGYQPALQALPYNRVAPVVSDGATAIRFMR